MRIPILIAAALLATAAAPKPAIKPAAFPAGPGQKPVQAACAACHAPAIVTGKRYSAAKWGDVVDQMIDRGAKVADADYDVIVAYLARNFGTK